jgi:hypothetical protein
MMSFKYTVLKEVEMVETECMDVSQHLPDGTDENHDKPQSVFLVCRYFPFETFIK